MEQNSEAPVKTLEGKHFKTLLTKRSSIKGQITKFKNYLNKITKQDIMLTAVEFAELTLRPNLTNCKLR